MNCIYYSEAARACIFDGPLDECPYEDDFCKCDCFRPGARIERGSNDVYEDKMKTTLESQRIKLPKYTAKITIGNWTINLLDKTFTKEQIKNTKELLGWDVENL